MVFIKFNVKSIKYFFYKFIRKEKRKGGSLFIFKQTMYNSYEVKKNYEETKNLLKIIRMR